MKKRLCALIMVGIFLVPMSISVKADPQSDLESKQADYEQIEKKIAKQQGEIYKIQGEMEPLLEKKNDNDKKIETFNKEIKELEVKIKEYEDKINEKEVTLGKRIRELYKSGGQVSYLTVILGANDLTELLSKLDTTNRILQLDKESIEELTTAQKELDVKKDDINQKKKELSRLSSENKRAVEELKVQEKKCKEILDDIEKEKSKFDSEYLAALEKQLLEYEMGIIDNPNSDKSDLEMAVASLQSIRDNQLKGEIAKNLANEYISKGNTKIEEIVIQNTPPKVGNDIVSTAALYIGCYYSMGATGPDVFDCSGFTQYVFAQHGISLGRTTYDQVNQGTPVDRANLQPGDLIFSYGGNHVGIYVGGGMQIHAANENLGVIKSPLYDYYKAVRI